MTVRLGSLHNITGDNSPALGACISKAVQHNLTQLKIKVGRLIASIIAQHNCLLLFSFRYSYSRLFVL